MRGFVAFFVLVLTVLAAGCETSEDVPIYPVPFRAADGALQIYDGNAFRPIFVKGMNMGVALPGTQAGELAVTAEDYDRWFAEIAALGVNTLRLYTLHYPAFYQRLHFYNVHHPEAPLYVLHGIWLDEDDPTLDLHDMEPSYRDNIVESIECVHGRKYIFERKGRAHGEYDADISPWVLAWVVGREVFPDEVEHTNAKGTRHSYQGELVSLPSGTETEVWWAQRIDEIASYEANHYGVYRPISVSSWPTLDPLHHPTETSNNGEDSQQIDLANLDVSRFPGGYFASYHAYPYYPDFMNEDPLYTPVRDSVGPDSYLGYLQNLRAHYYPKPLLVAEVGVPSSWGDAHFAHSGMDHGGENETQQGEYDVRLFRNAWESKTAGAVLFAWIDEWWKRTWIVDELALPRERYKLWHNVTSPEQNFGLLKFELPPPDFGMFPEQAGTGRVTRVRGAADAEYFHVELTLTRPLEDGEELTVGYDTYADDRGDIVLPNGVHTKQRSEFGLIVRTTGAELYVMGSYDQFGVWHDTQAAWHTPNGPRRLFSGRPYRSVAIDGGGWNLVRWENNGPHGSDDGTFRFPMTVQDIGRLHVKHAGERLDVLDAVLLDGNVVRVRLPWSLLQVTDPSDPRVIDDDPNTQDRETSPTDGFRIAVSIGTDLVETPRWKWAGWDGTPAYTEVKKAAYEIVRAGLATVPDQPAP